jgi:hypothetical protein
MAAGLLYSTNVFLKLHIQRTYQQDVHHIWCSENFDSAALARYAPGAGVPPSSNPADIYRRLKEAVRKSDTHDEKIAAQKASLLTLAVKWADAGSITQEQRADIVYRVNSAPFEHWRPLIYVVPTQGIHPNRLTQVPANQCAGLGPEFIIRDLQGNEFDIIEP